MPGLNVYSDHGTYDQIGVTYDGSVTDTQFLFDSLVPFVTEQDEALGSPLYNYIDSFGQLIQFVDDLIRDDCEGPGWSIVLDVDRCPTVALPWLGQWVGVRVPPGLDDRTMRNMIRAEQGFHRGTRERIITAVKAFLLPPADVFINERDTDPYHFGVIIRANQLIGGTYADLSTAYPLYSNLTAAFSTYAQYTSSINGIMATLAALKPAGLQYTLTVQ